MKKFTYIITFFALWTLSGCKDFLGGDTNIDPSRITEEAITLQVLLPTVIFYTSDSHFSTSFVTSRYTQQIGDVIADGTDIQREQSLPGVWSNVYLNTVSNLNIMMDKATKQSQPFYLGVGKILMAINLGLATNQWENIPYSQADQGTEGIFRPGFDTQEQIFTAIQKLLDDGIATLTPVTSTTRADDIAYAGNVTRWIRLANTLKARYFMELSKRNPTTAATNALAALAGGFQANVDDFQLVYNGRNFNPWHSNVALANNTGNLTITHSAYFINQMNGTAGNALDPRLPLIAARPATATTWVGVTAGRGTGSGSNVSFNTTTWQSTQTAPIQMCTFAEAKFLEAEARFILNGGTQTSVGTNAAAYLNYQDGIRASLGKIGVAAAPTTSFLADSTVSMGATRLRLSNIMAQKYVALFLHPEVWTDMRRYDYSTNVYRGLALPVGHSPELQGKWIQRMSYPSSENSRNTDAVKANFKTIATPMWMFGG